MSISASAMLESTGYCLSMSDFIVKQDSARYMLEPRLYAVSVRA